METEKNAGKRTLFAALAAEVDEWRRGGYRCDYPLIGEILRFQHIGDYTEGVRGGELRFLRAAQFAALETYWYLRLVKNTPHILDLYREYYPNLRDFAPALGVSLSKIDLLQDNTVDGFVRRIKDREWAEQKRIDAVHESATLEYPGYIFALAMGAGKTILIGAIIATEFAMALHYDGKPGKTRFMQNALVFAPGRTILESLREIADLPADKILPPVLYRQYAANVKIEFARDGQKDFSAQANSVCNIIVSNTEKIHLRANTRRTRRMNELKFARKRAQDEAEANLRLQKIASLPNLGVFSDEAHHTYGNRTGDNIKRVRQTVNYIHRETPLVAVVNTTGTPYYKRALLSEVVCRYGLGDGIKDNVLKSLRNGVHSYDIGGANAGAEVVRDIIREFYGRYKNTRLPDGAPAKIAFYFKTQEHLDESRPHIERAMTEIGEPVTHILVNTQQSVADAKKEFARLNDPANQKRVILLVQIGVEGWNCPSLFACALVKEQTGDIFVLQAATRCLRQTPGNAQNATVFLSETNKTILERELQANFGEGLRELGGGGGEPMISVAIKIRKTNLPKIEITRKIKYFARKDGARDKAVSPTLTLPQTPPAAEKIIVQPGSLDADSMRILHFGGGETVQMRDVSLCAYLAAYRISANYHLPVMPVLKQLQKLYPDGEVPGAHFSALLKQVEEQTADYEEKTEITKEVLALIKTIGENGAPAAKDKDGCYVHHLRFSKSKLDEMLRKNLVVSADGGGETRREADDNDVSYHCTPYCFDSGTEKDFFDKILGALNEDPDDIRAFIFIGFARERLTDFYFDYKGVDGEYHRYFPDFLLLKNSGEFYAVEIKAENTPDRDVESKRAAMKSLVNLPENRFRYAVIYADKGGISDNEPNLADVRRWIWGGENS